MGNHLISDSAPTINAGDDMSTIDHDENILSMTSGPRRRRHDDEEDGSETYDDDDDLESMASVPVGGEKKSKAKVEEEKELPLHACA